jgi:hypothetical protein
MNPSQMRGCDLGAPESNPQRISEAVGPECGPKQRSCYQEKLQDSKRGSSRCKNINGLYYLLNARPTPVLLLTVHWDRGREGEESRKDKEKKAYANKGTGNSMPGSRSKLA